MLHFLARRIRLLRHHSLLRRHLVSVSPIGCDAAAIGEPPILALDCVATPYPDTFAAVVVTLALGTVAAGRAALSCSPIMDDMRSFISAMKAAESRLGLR